MRAHLPLMFHRHSKFAHRVPNIDVVSVYSVVQSHDLVTLLCHCSSEHMACLQVTHGGLNFYPQLVLG